MKNKKEIIAFTDGSSRGNPGPGGWGVVLLVPEGDGMRVVEKGGGEGSTTNNRMEMTAALEALKFIKDLCSDESFCLVTIYTDSSYLIKGITGWVFSWEKNNWRKKDGEPVKNEDLWRELLLFGKNMKTSWVHVKGHTGVPGNERADLIACSFADGEEVLLKNIDHKDYGVDLLSFKQNSTSSKNTKSSSKRAYSYISKVDGKVVSHESWESCKKRVEGISGALFKKVYSREEEDLLMRKWSD